MLPNLNLKGGSISYHILKAIGCGDGF